MALRGLVFLSRKPVVDLVFLLRKPALALLQAPLQVRRRGARARQLALRVPERSGLELRPRPGLLVRQLGLPQVQQDRVVGDERGRQLLFMHPLGARVSHDPLRSWVSTLYT